MADVGIGSRATIAPLQPDDDPTSTAQRWSTWVQPAENLFVAVEHHRQRSEALPSATPGRRGDVRHLRRTRRAAGCGGRRLGSRQLVHGDAACSRRSRQSRERNAEFEVYTFRLARRNIGESMDTYQVRRRAPAKYCEFANLDGELKSHIIQTCATTSLRRRALAETTVTLQQIDAARSTETAELQVKVTESGQKEATGSTVAAVRIDRSSGRRRPQQSSKQGTSSTTCRNCGRGFPHPRRRERCPSMGEELSDRLENGSHHETLPERHRQQIAADSGIIRSPPTAAIAAIIVVVVQSSVRQVREGASDVAGVDGADSDNYAYTVGSATKTKQASVE